MKTIETQNPEVNAAQSDADFDELYRQLANGRCLDPELVRRIQDRAEKAREANLRVFGVQDIGVQIIRDMRDAR